MTVGVDSVAWPTNAPYVTMAGLNLLACDLTAATTAVTAVVPVTRSYEKDSASTAHGATLLTSSLATPTGEASDGGCLDAFAV
jgi:hypothetical protein